MTNTTSFSCRRLCRMKFSNIFLGFCSLMVCLLVVDYLRGLRNPSENLNSGRHGNRRTTFHHNKQVCTHPKLNIEEDTLAGFFHKMPPLRCPGESLMYLEDGILNINQTVLAGRSIKRCVYRAVDTTTDRAHYYSKPHIRNKPPFGIRIKHDFFRVECFLNNQAVDQTMSAIAAPAPETGTGVLDFDDDFKETPDYDQFFAQIVPSMEVQKRTEEAPPSEETRMNVLVIPIDSMSRLNYERKLPKTYQYLKHELDAVILKGQSIIGDGAAVNIIGMTTGHHMAEMEETGRDKKGSTYVDRYPFIWYDYERAGYVTLYAEDDEPSLGTFQMRLNGFEQVPTDHYLRPFWLAAWDSDVDKNSPRFCLGNKPKHQYLLDYLKEFFNKYPKAPKFAFVFPGELSHRNVNPVEFLDDDLVKLFEFLKTGGFLENTLIVMGGDHGVRYSQVRHTFQGKQEERLPMMALAFPSWFRYKYVDAISHLERNAETLTTPYDLYETLKDVLDSSRLDQRFKHNQRGMSLLRAHPMNRTCASAGVAIHYCTCARYTEQVRNDVRVQNAAKQAVRYINSLTNDVRNVCATLSLGSVIEAMEITANETILHNTGKTTATQELVHYQITFNTSPNHGLYEATVALDKSLKSYQTMGISRTNSYGTDPHCVVTTHPELRRFCFCKTPYKKGKGPGLDHRWGRG